MKHTPIQKTISGYTRNENLGSLKHSIFQFFSSKMTSRPSPFQYESITMSLLPPPPTKKTVAPAVIPKRCIRLDTHNPKI